MKKGKLNKIDFIKKIEKSDGEEKYKAILDYSRFLRQTDPQESVKQAKRVLKIAHEIDNDLLMLNALTYIATSYIYCSDMKHAEKWLEALKEKGEELGLDKALGDYYNMLARIKHQQNNSSAALELLLKALEYYLNTDSATDKISCYNALGIIHLEMEERDKAKYYLELALEVSEEYNNPAQHSIRLNLSNILFSLNDFKNVIKINMDSLKFFQDNGMKMQEATALGNIGLCYYNIGENEKALEYLLPVRKIYLEVKNQRKIAHTSLSIARANIESSKFQEALPFLKEALETAEKNHFKMDMVEIYKTYARFFEKQDNLTNANIYLHKMFDKYVEVNNENKKKEFKELEAKYNTEIYKIRNEELIQHNKAMNKQIAELNDALVKLQNTYGKLQIKFESSADEINKQGDLLSSQARMAVMGEMISAIAHQWKQPLNIIWILAQAIKDAWEFDEINDEFINNQTRQIGEQISYMSDTINDFRNFFKEEYVKEFKVSDAIEKALKLAAYMLKQSGITVIKNLNSDCTLNGNPNELMQVILNIINNARQAIEESNPKNREINISLNCENNNVIISIHNNGDNIAEDNLSKIFQPYFTTKGETGTGIGLNICQHIVRNKFNGDISVENKPDGVIFYIECCKNITD